jgi:hypothetical protein
LILVDCTVALKRLLILLWKSLSCALGNGNAHKKVTGIKIVFAGFVSDSKEFLFRGICVW